MRSFYHSQARLTLLAVVMTASAWLANFAIAGESQPYTVLQVQTCPQVQPAPAAPYAYGWFGASPRAHATRSFGYYKLYTEWSWR